MVEKKSWTKPVFGWNPTFAIYLTIYKIYFEIHDTRLIPLKRLTNEQYALFLFSQKSRIHKLGFHKSSLLPCCTFTDLLKWVFTSSNTPPPWI